MAVAQESSKVFIKALRNGDATQTPFRIAVYPGDDFDAILKRASAKLATRGEADKSVQFTRAFVEDVEINQTDEFNSGDVVYFSQGENYIKPRVSERKEGAYVAVASEAKEAEKKQFLQHIANAAVVQASQLYDSTSSYVFAKSPDFVKVTLEKVQGRVVSVASPVATKVKQYGRPVLEWADGRIDSAYTQVSSASRRTRRLPAEVAKSINDNYIMPVLMPIQHRVHDASAAFFQVAVDNWHALQTTAQDGKVRVGDFVDAMRHKLGNTWNDRLVDPAKQFFTTVQKELEDVTRQQEDKGKIASVFANVKTKLGSAWEQKVKANLKLPEATPESVKSVAHRVSQPAEAFYRYALEAYHNLAQSANGAQVTFSEFLVTLRGRLGSAWNAGLMAPAQYMYDMFRGERSVAGLIQSDDEFKTEDDGDVPANTATPLPSSLHSDSPRGSGANSPHPEQQVLYPNDGDEDVVLPEDQHEFVPPIVTATPPPRAETSSASSSPAPSASSSKGGAKKKKAKKPKASQDE